MKEYNPKIEEGTKSVDCVCYDYHAECCEIGIVECPEHDNAGKVVIPSDCPAREGILIKVKE